MSSRSHTLLLPRRTSIHQTLSYIGRESTNGKVCSEGRRESELPKAGGQESDRLEGDGSLCAESHVTARRLGPGGFRTLAEGWDRDQESSGVLFPKPTLPPRAQRMTSQGLSCFINSPSQTRMKPGSV